LHVDDLAVTDGEDLEALLTAAVGCEPAGRADDLVADLGELRRNHDLPFAALAELELQDLPGLVRAVSRRSLLPPQMSPRDAAPLVPLGDQRDKGLWVTPTERLGSDAQLVDHGNDHARSLTTFAGFERTSRAALGWAGFGTVT